MQVSEFVCVWFKEQHHVLLVDRRSLLSAGSDSDRSALPGWRLVAANLTSTGYERPGGREAGRTIISPWPPFRPVDLPLLFGPQQGPLHIQIFDFSPGQREGSGLCARTQFTLDPSLMLSQAHTWWALACLDPADAWRGGLFGAVASIGRHAVVANTDEALANEIIARVCEATPRMTLATTYLIVPVAGTRIGPTTILAHRKFSNPGPTVDIVFEPRNDGTSQPVIKLRAAPGTDLEDIIASFQIFVLRRNAANFDLPDLARSWIGPESRSQLADHVTITVAEPVLHGDVIGIMSRGIAFKLAPNLASEDEISIETWDSWHVALLVRREDSVSSARGDRSLVYSGCLDRLRDRISDAATDSTIDGFLCAAKGNLGSALKRTGIATSYLMDPGIASHVRAKFADALSDCRQLHLEHLAYAAAAPQRLQLLTGDENSLDGPWRLLSEEIDESVLIACIAEIAGLEGQNVHSAGRIPILELLRDRDAVQAVLNVTTRSQAMADWEATMKSELA